MHRLRSIGVFLSLWCFAAFLLFHAGSRAAQTPSAPAESSSPYLGFDRNLYPGDDAMRLLRRDFFFTGYWLSPPPGEKSSTWQGKREALHSLGYGFLLLYSAPDSSKLKSAAEAGRKGIADAKGAAYAAWLDGFASNVIVFADIEEGGRLTPNYHAYLKAWAAELHEHRLRPGVYCSGMPVNEGAAATITTAADLHDDPALAEFTFWVYNDACPPSPGCSAGNTTAARSPQSPPAPAASGIGFALVWQFAQSPRRKQYTAHCRANYAPDGSCYAPSDKSREWFLDLNSATSPDPSGGAR